MTPADVHPGMARRDERDGDADVLALPDQAVRVVQAEGQAEQRSDRAQRDVALLPGHAHAQHTLAVVLTPAHDPVVRNRTGVRPRFGPGEREARHLHALGEPREVVTLLLLGTIVQQQFRRPQRVGHHHGHARGRAAAGELHHHRRMRQRGKTQAAVLLGNDHPEKALVLDELPGLGRQVLELVGDLPLVDHAAQRFDRSLQECALLCGQRRPRHGQQFVPVRATAEQVAVPPHGARVQRLLFGLRHLREHAPEPAQQWIADQHAAQLGDQQHRRRGDEHGPQHAAPYRRQSRQRGTDQEGRTSGAPHPTRRTKVRQRPDHGDEGCEPEQECHRDAPENPSVGAIRVASSTGPVRLLPPAAKRPPAPPAGRRSGTARDA